MARRADLRRPRPAGRRRARRRGAARPRRGGVLDGYGATTRTGCAGIAPPPRCTISVMLKRTATTRRASPVACGPRARAPRSSTAREPPARVAHVLNSMGLGGVPQVAWELVRRLPADRYDLRVVSLRRAKGERPRARPAGGPRGSRRPRDLRRRRREHRRRRAAVRLARRARASTSSTPLLPAEPPGRLAALPLRESGTGSSPITTTPRRQSEKEGTLTLERPPVRGHRTGPRLLGGGRRPRRDGHGSRRSG